MDLADRLAGGVWGHLVGDAVGVPYEFKPPSTIKAVKFGAIGTHRQPAGTWSDDGSLMLAQLDSLLAVGFDPADFGRRAVDWYRRGRYTPDDEGRFDVGTTTSVALRALEGGADAGSSGPSNEHSNGNGSLMRILPLALVDRDVTDDVLADRAHRLSRVTHGTVRAQVACALYVLVARHLLRGEPRTDALAAAKARLREIYHDGDDHGSHLAALDHLAAWPTRQGKGRVWDSFWSAWYAFADATDYRGAVERAVRYGNDTDTTAAIAGGLAGIRFGVDGIPPDWLDGMRGRDLVAPLVDKLVATTGLGTSTTSPLRVDWIDTQRDIPLVARAGGRLGMTMLPGKRVTKHWRDVEPDVERLRDAYLCDALVLLVEDHELTEFRADRIPQALESHHIDLVRYPIPDTGTPRDRDRFRTVLDGVIERLLAGQAVVVVCRGGLGRTGLTVACLIRDVSDASGHRAIKSTRLARPGTVENREQARFVEAWDWPRRPAVAAALAAEREPEPSA